MSSHARPVPQPDPYNGHASGDGAYGDGGSYGDGGYAGRSGYATGGQQGYGEVYGAPYQDAEQAYAGYGYTPSYGDAGYGDPGYAEAGYAEAGYAEAFPGADGSAHAAPYAPEPLPADRAEAAGPGSLTGARPASRTGTRAQIRAVAKARSRRKRRVRNGFLGVGSVAAVTVIAVAALMHPGAQKTGAVAAAGPTVDSGRSSSAPADASRSNTRPTPATALARLPGLGASFRAKIPANAQQVLLVTGTGKDANTSTAVLYTRTDDGSWLPGTAWAAHNAKDGWTSAHMAGDLHSPIGVYSLTDAGGLDANPGTKLPYLHSSAFRALGTGFEGESLADAFDYVIAINYNHDPGTSPLSAARPMGASRGGGIWIHVDHGGPTHGCVSLSKANMAILLKDLDPSKHPVIVMGDAASLRA